MFDNIGGKIKTLAVVTCFLGIISSVIVGLSQLDHGGILILLLGCLGSWIGAFFIYGFGELIEQATIAAENTTEIRDALRSLQPAQAVKAKAAPIAHPSTPSGKPIPRTENNHLAPAGIVTPVLDSTTDEIICPNCGTRQKEHRRVCWSCGQQFKE